MLFVTHNVREAARLGDRIVLLTSRPGRVAATYPVGLARVPADRLPRDRRRWPRRSPTSSEPRWAPWRLTDRRPRRSGAGLGHQRHGSAHGADRRRQPRPSSTGPSPGSTPWSEAGRSASDPSGRAPVAGHLAQADRLRAHPARLADRGLGPLEALHPPVTGHRGPAAVGAARHLARSGRPAGSPPSRPSIGYALVVVIGGSSRHRRGPSAGPACRHRIADHRHADHALGALVPARRSWSSGSPGRRSS